MSNCFPFCPGKRTPICALMSTALARLFRLDVRGLDDRPPFLDFRLVERAEIFGGLFLARPDLVALVGELLSYGGVGQRIDDSLVELGDDIPGRALRRPDRLPRRDVETGRARLVHRRDI